MDKDLINEIIWVMTNYGSDAGERQEPGSKLKSQAERIAQFLFEREEVNQYIGSRGFNTVAVLSWNGYMEHTKQERGK